MTKEEIKKDIEKEICPICKSKISLYLIENGETWQAYKCNQCKSEINVRLLQFHVIFRKDGLC